MLFHIVPSGSSTILFLFCSVTSRAWKMRSAFVVLVLLCIGLVSGFIVPSSVPEHSTKKNNISHTDTSKDVKVKSSTTAKYAELPKSRSNIDEIDLYEHATEKKNNQSERAFIYINQKYNKNPFRSKLIKMLPIDRLEFPYTYVTGRTAPTALTSVAQTPCPSAFDSAPNFNSKFQGFNLADSRQRQEVSSYFSAPNTFKCKFNDESKKNELSKVTMQIPTSQRVDERRDYFELLKTPILRPVNHKVNYDNIHYKIGLPSLLTSSVPYSKSFIKKYNLKNMYVPQAKEEAVARQNEIRKNYGFNGAFIRRPAYQTKKLTNRVEDANFEDAFINEDDYRRNFVNNQEEDKLLDKYLKDTLEDVSLLNVNDKVRANDCIQDCILEPRKKLTKNNGLLIKPDCQCGKIPSVKPVDPFISKDRSLREESDRNVTQPKSSEVVYYEEVLSDELNMIKQDDDVIRPPNKINQTSFL